MNAIEKFVYDMVKATPGIKLFLRNTYQGFFDLLPRKREFFIKPIEYKEGLFYGFHDTNPFSLDQTKVLANRAESNLKMPSQGDTLDVGYVPFTDGKLGDFVKLDESLSWNFHKGCRLQWLTTTKVIFNTMKGNNLVSKVVDVENSDSYYVNWPIDTVSKKGDFATSFSYERLEYCMPGYGYIYSDESYLDVNLPEETGLFLINLKSNTKKLIVPIKKLVGLYSDIPDFRNVFHYVTHSEFSDNGRYISFLHRTRGKDIRKRWTKLLIYDTLTGNLDIAPTGDMVSHYVWNDRNEIIAYCNFQDVDCHVLIPAENLSATRKVAYPMINSDGHQSFINSKEFITDTYPDKFRMGKLYHVNSEDSTIRKIASLYAPKKYQTRSSYQHITCDLHPRVSRDGKYVCFDSARTGVRSLCVMELP